MLELDLKGLNCPLPVLKTKKFLAQLDSGEVVTILTTDPASLIDFKEFCQKSGNILISQEQVENIITTIIQRR
jgi:tRNA 2-thiouridine synthesizing protein A